MALDANVSCKEICRLCYNRFKDASTSIERLTLTDREHLDTVIVSNGSRHIYFVCNSAVKTVINFESDIADICFNEKHSALYVGTNSGQLHSIPVSVLQSATWNVQQSQSSAKSQDIFADLLQPDASRPLADSGVSQQILDVTRDKAILGVTGVQRVLTVDENIIILVAVQHGWVVEVYEREQVLCGRGKLPVSPVYQHYIADDNSKSSTSVRMHCCLLAGSALAKTYDKNKHFCSVDANLFQNLFGEDARLLESPVLLIWTHDGAVYAVPLMGGTRKPDPRLICHLQEPVADVISFREEAASSDASISSCLIFVGSGGRVISATAGSQDRMVKFTECTIAGPVHCLTVHNRHLVYSTRKQLCYVPLRDLTETERVGPAVQCSVWAVSGVVAVVSLCALTCTTAAGELLVVTATGRILHIDVPVTSTARRSVTAHSVKDLLTTIGHLADQQSVLDDTLSHQGATLKQLSIASSVAAHNSESSLGTNFDASKSSSCDDNQPFTIAVDFKKNYAGMSYKSSVVATMRLSARLKLNRRWRFIVNVSSLNQCLTKSVCVVGDFLEVVVDVPDAMLLQLPLDVACCLAFHVEVPERTVSVAVHRRRFDAIDMCVSPDDRQVSPVVTLSRRGDYEELLRCVGSGASDEVCIDRLKQYDTTVNICDREAVPGLTETTLLQKLLGDVASGGGNSCRLHCLPDSHSVVVTVCLSNDRYAATINTRDIFTLVQMRTAVTDRVQQWFPDSLCTSLETTAARTQLRQLQSLDTQLRLLQDEKQKQSTSDQQKLITEAYLQLRQVLL